MAKRRKSSKSKTPMAEKVEAVLSSAEKDRKEKKNKYNPVDESPLRSIFCLKKMVDMERLRRLRIALSLILTLSIPLTLPSSPPPTIAMLTMNSPCSPSVARWPVEIIHTQGIFVCNFHSILHLMTHIVTCVTLMFAILQLLASIGPHTAMPRSTSRTGDLNAV
ncbi:hypothetical protein F3Y22_tig00110569pilonHSYRG00061 [Hibiscus syriacus]|uniref:Uncharacterized protein n=1 Tax=Hibiscus syriacus TaxID=106335 RepID=A0A6A3A6P8_HIBSY|nr:hypothetical protein F3Y22_tig00110569pilonHSYRG00061 [Hibiscus syriacus]